jgi:salicylate hydroxylase
MSLEVVHSSGRQELVEGIDLLIAADGRYSGLRQQLGGAATVTQLGVGNFRVLLDDAGEWPIDDLEQWFNGPHRLLAFRLQGGLVYLSGNIPIDAGSDIPPERKMAQWLERAYTPADGVLAEAPRRLLQGACRAAAEGALHWSRLQEGSFRWHDDSGRVLFPGDAGHPMVPTLGQGATTAIEDGALFVAHLNRALEAGPVDVPDLLRNFAAARAARIDFVSRFSWDASDVLLQGAADADLVRAKGGEPYRGKLRRLYSND